MNAVFAVLTILGNIANPTTEGLQDSDRAMTYDKPWADADYTSAGKHEAKKEGLRRFAGSLNNFCIKDGSIKEDSLK